MKYLIDTNQKRNIILLYGAKQENDLIFRDVFEEGNKRTAAALFITYCEANKKAYDIYKIDIVIRDLIQKRISDISKIRRMIKNATV